MKFKTAIEIPKYPFQIGLDDPLLLIGSCFSDYIGDFLNRGGFQALNNPFGTLFNPISIASDLQLALHPEKFTSEWIYQHQQQWLSFAHSTKFSSEDYNSFIQNIKNQLHNTHNALLKAHYLFVTFGTAFYYLFKEKNIIVANCHKISAVAFEKKRVEIEQVVERYTTLFHDIDTLNPELKIIFTVSPVRHLSDGFHENQVSKSILHLIVEQLVDHQKYFYFPSYEILNDDLRDYRFYGADLVHPTSIAIEYISEIFRESFFSLHTIEKVKLFEKEAKSRLHINQKLTKNP
ncbi:MAG: GSCFA domain-containing protein [Bacteroidales bacterium]|jgi:hypothetical protein|nr:GSCFA domain-containing protein [Bacteroidales bacterium]